ncbi:hypothetical protein WMF30_40270 [Sorangium sp. So ce134]
MALTPSCRRCLEEFRAGRALERREYLRRRLWHLWSDRGALYSHAELERIEADIREQVGRELGGWNGDSDVPGSLCVDPTWLDDRRAPAADAPDAEAAPPAPPVTTVEERRARGVDDALKQARSPRPAPLPPRADWLGWLSSSAAP